MTVAQEHNHCDCCIHYEEESPELTNKQLACGHWLCEMCEEGCTEPHEIPCKPCHFGPKEDDDNDDGREEV